LPAEIAEWLQSGMCAATTSHALGIAIEKRLQA
jgi:hypothetical protein